MKKNQSIISLSLAALLCSAVPVAAKKKNNTKKPNVILIVADDLGNADVGYNNLRSDIKTPNIDQLATSGVRFTTGYVTGPVCGPSRAGMLTGTYQQTFGFNDNPGPFRRSPDIKPGIPLNVPTVAEHMQSAGYTTGAIGKWHVGGQENRQFIPTNRGFDHYYGFLGGAASYFSEDQSSFKFLRNEQLVAKPQNYLTDVFGDESVQFINDHKEDPFFLYVAFNAVHTPLQVPDSLLHKFDHIKNLKRRQLVAMQYAMDCNIGKILSALEANDLDDRTMIVFISDNGGKPGNNESYNTPYNGMKGTLWEGGIRLPFAMKLPGVIPANTVYKNSVISLDIMPTVLAAVGAEVPKDIDGVNLLPHITNKKQEAPHETLFWWINKKWAIRDSEWKLMYDDKAKKEYLFKISEDISEQNDVHEQYPEVVKRLKKEFNQWKEAAMLPLWGWNPGAVGNFRNILQFNFEAITPEKFTGKNSQQPVVLSNPMPDALNQSNTVLKATLVKTGNNPSEVGVRTSPYPRRQKFVHVKVNAEQPVELFLRLNGKNEKVEVKPVNGYNKANQWQDLVFDVSTFKGKVQYITIGSHQVDQKKLDIYIDDIIFTNQATPITSFKKLRPVNLRNHAHAIEEDAMVVSWNPVPGASFYEILMDGKVIVKNDDCWVKLPKKEKGNQITVVAKDNAGISSLKSAVFKL